VAALDRFLRQRVAREGTLFQSGVFMQAAAGSRLPLFCRFAPNRRRSSTASHFSAPCYARFGTQAGLSADCPLDLILSLCSKPPTIFDRFAFSCS
jgi:hypothetical protein